LAEIQGPIFLQVKILRNVAILVDGGFFLKRIIALGHLPEPHTQEVAINCLKEITKNHLNHLNRRYGFIVAPGNGDTAWRSVTNPARQLYRTFYYDSEPYTGRAERPITRTNINFANTATAEFRRGFFTELKKSRNVALRMGKLASKGEWVLNQRKQKALLRGTITIADLTDDDFKFDLKQKGVDMRIGLDIATLTLKKQVQTIVLITGDSDFVPAAKLARREGVEIILDPLRHNISSDLFEHIDGLRHGLNQVNLPVTDEDEDDDA